MLGVFLSFRRKKAKLGKGGCRARPRGGKGLLCATLKLSKRELWGGGVDKVHKCQDCPNLCLNLLSFHFTSFIGSQRHPQGLNYYLTYVLNSFPGCSPAFPTAHQMSRQICHHQLNSTFSNHAPRFLLQASHDS